MRAGARSHRALQARVRSLGVSLRAMVAGAGGGTQGHKQELAEPYWNLRKVTGLGRKKGLQKPGMDERDAQQRQAAEEAGESSAGGVGWAGTTWKWAAPGRVQQHRFGFCQQVAPLAIFRELGSVI